MFKYFLKEFNPEIQDIAFKLTFLSVNCIKWSCIFSGLGIINPFTEKDIKRFDALTPDRENLKSIVKDTVPLKCIYKKGKPLFALPIDTVINPGKYMWDFSTFDKTIEIPTQAFAILSLVTASKLLYKYDMNTSIVMLNMADDLICFSSAYLKQGDGMYISAVNKTKEPDNSINLKYEKSSSKIIDQVYMHEAYICYTYTLSNKVYPKYLYQTASKHRDEARCIFEYISSNPDLLIQMSTRDVSMCISSMARCCSMDSNLKNIEHYKEIIAMLCAELESRTKATGEIDRGYSNLAPASYITHFRGASALIEGSIITNIYKFMETSDEIYCYLENLYNTDLGIYTQEKGKTINITIRDICEMIRFQFLRYSVYERDETLYIISRLYKEWIEASGIVQCVPDFSETFLGRDTSDFDSFLRMDNISMAPVFLKGLKLNFKKDNQRTISKGFNSYYSLYSSYMFLYYLNSLITKPQYMRNDDTNDSHEFIDEIKVADEITEEMDTPPNPPVDVNDSSEKSLELKGDNNAKKS